MTKEEVARMIDHTVLMPNITEFDIKKLCSEARKWNFASVCVNPCYVNLAKEQLQDTEVKICTVIGFPLGQETSCTKAFGAYDAIKNGADEIDMVINISKVLDGDYIFVEKDIKEVVDKVKQANVDLDKNAIVKVILETCYLSDEQIVACCKCCVNAKADFVKTSTGFGTPKAIDGKPLPNGASSHHVALMKKAVDGKLKVKASGGIRSSKTALEMINSGADRLGTSSGVLIVESWKE